MPTIMSHAVVPLVMGAVAGGRIAAPIVVAGAALAILPDSDVIGFAFGIDYGSDWGHRGATHSLAFAGIAAGVLALVWPAARNGTALAFLTLCAVSHGLLDMLTSGGLGVALYWPFDIERIFAPWRPIRVSPIGTGFFSMRGGQTFLSELRWIWLPALLIVGVSAIWKRARSNAASLRAEAGIAVASDDADSN